MLKVHNMSFDLQKGTKAQLHDACLVMDTLGGRMK